MNTIAHFLLAALNESPFVLIRNAELTLDTDGIPFIGKNSINDARAAMATEGYLQEFAEAPAFCIAIRDNMGRHYFHFMETFLTLYAVHREIFPKSWLLKIYMGRFEWNNPYQNNIQRKIYSLLYPDVEIVADLNTETVMVDNLVYIDRRLTQTSINKMIEPLQSMVLKWATDLRKTVYKALEIVELSDFLATESATRLPKILYIPRHPPRTLTKEVEASLLEILSIVGTVKTVDFSNLSWKDQVRTAADHDIMVGVHGNGLTNLLWMPAHAMVIEIFPENWHQYDYQVMSEVMQLEYFGFEGSNIFRQFSRHGNVYGVGAEIKPVSRLMKNEILLALNTFALRRR